MTAALVVVLMVSFGFVTGFGVAAASEIAAVEGSVFHTDVQSVFVGTTFNPSQEPPGSCGVISCYTPQEIQDGYNYGPAYKAVGGYANAGAGQTIVIIDAYGDPSVASNLATFDSTFGLPSANLNVICPAGCPTLDLSGDSAQSLDEIGWTGEITLDTQYSHAMAPAATIDLVVAHSDSNSDILVAEQYALQHHLGQIWSQSFGEPECDFTPGASSPWFAANNLVYQEAAAEGITMFASAGDLGATLECPTNSAAYPADNPLEIAVGGTFLQLSFAKGATVASPLVSAPATYGHETTWNDFENATLAADGLIFGVTGGAPSQYFAAPGYQLINRITPYTCAGDTPSTCSAGTPYHSFGRVDTDVAYDAGVDGGVLAYYDVTSSAMAPGYYIFGGTSAGSPQWAAITAIADQLHHGTAGNFAPLLYFLGSTGVLHDIRVGSNAFEPGTGFEATRGYDAPTGMGTPNVGNLIWFI
ncbi:MAG: S53 family peptidase [Thermoplasmata archaeon]